MGRKADQDAFASSPAPLLQPGTTTRTAAPPPPLPPRHNADNGDRRNPCSDLLFSETDSTDEALPPPAYTPVDPASARDRTPRIEAGAATERTYHSQPMTSTWSAQDPRSSSTQSLVPEGDAGSAGADDNDATGSGSIRDAGKRRGKRKLLLIWIHGFMGNETSFQSFPAHVHNAVVQRVSDYEEQGEGGAGQKLDYVVHTKIYPRYKSRNRIEGAREEFSAWLAPHEDPNTDIILLGHSLGGILSAEVALKPAFAGEHCLYRHRILGTVNFDTPFLGMHPGVIASGLGSLFRPPAETPTTVTRAGSAEASSDGVSRVSSENPYFNENQGSSSTSSTNLMPTETRSSSSTLPLSSPLDSPSKDPNYDPPFSNDVRRPQRTGWSNAWHFINKHSDGLTKATKSYVTSHLEFGGCLADYNGLKTRYAALRELEDGREVVRVRFVNYYTASTGRPKKVKPKSSTDKREMTGVIDGDLPVINGDQSVATGHEHDQANGEAKRLREEAARMEIEAARMRGESMSIDQAMEKLAVRTDHHPLVPEVSIEQAEEDSLAGKELQDSPDRRHLDTGDDQDGGHSSDLSIDMDHMTPQPLSDKTDIDDSNSDSESDDFHSLAESTSLEQTPSTSSSTSKPDAADDPDKKTPHPLLLPPIPAEPVAPEPFNPTPYPDKDTRKLAEKDHARAVKAYERAVKDRQSAIKDRQKLIEKREAAAAAAEKKKLKTKEKIGAGAGQKDDVVDAKAERRAQAKKDAEDRKKEAKRRINEERERKRAAKAVKAAKKEEAAAAAAAVAADNDNDNDHDHDNENDIQASERSKTKPRRDRKFCLLPPYTSSTTSSSTANADIKKKTIDPCWIRVFMPGMDEVGAHCGLFFVDGERYEWFVGDVADRVVGWLR